MSLDAILDSTLSIVGWSSFALAILLGLALNLLGFFGSWVILLASVLVYVVTGFEHLSIIGLVALLVLALIGEALEAAAAGMGASRFGGERGAMVAAVVGCLAGAVFLTGLVPIPIISTVVGACAGAFLAATIYEYIKRERKVHEAAWTGLGAALGKVGGMLAKFMIAWAMVLVIALDLWVFPRFGWT